MRREITNLCLLSIICSLLLASVVGFKDLVFDNSPIVDFWAPEALPSLTARSVSFSSTKIELTDEMKLLLTTEMSSVVDGEAEQTHPSSQVFLFGDVMEELEANKVSLENVCDGDLILVFKNPASKIDLEIIKFYFTAFGGLGEGYRVLQTLSTDFGAEAWAVKITKNDLKVVMKDPRLVMKDLKFAESLKDNVVDNGITIVQELPEGVSISIQEENFANILINGEKVSAYAPNYNMLILKSSDNDDDLDVENPNIEIQNNGEFCIVQTARVRNGDWVLVYHSALYPEPKWEWFSNLPASLPSDLPYVLLPVVDPEVMQKAFASVEDKGADSHNILPLKNDGVRALELTTDERPGGQDSAHDPHHGSQEVNSDVKGSQDTFCDEKNDVKPQ